MGAIETKRLKQAIADLEANNRTMLTDLPGVVMWTPNATHGAAGFRFDGGEGIIMSLWGI